MKHAVIRVKLGAFAADRTPADPSPTTIFREASVAYSPPGSSAGPQGRKTPKIAAVDRIQTAIVKELDSPLI